MSHHHFKIETLGLLLELLPNHYSHQYSCFHCRCRCYQRRTIQINIITKYKRISRRVLELGHHIETLERNVRKEALKSDINEQRKGWSQNTLRLIGRRTLKHQVSKKSQRTRVVSTKENNPVRKIRLPEIQDSQTKKQNNLRSESFKLLLKNKITK